MFSSPTAQEFLLIRVDSQDYLRHVKSFAFMSGEFMYDNVKIWIAAVLLATLSGCVTTSGVTVPSTNYYDKKVVDLHPEVFQVGQKPRPTVIVLHGSGGVDVHHRDWAKLINSWGYNAVVFDSFRPRGLSDVNGKPFDVPPLQRAVDAETVAKWIKLQPWSSDKICAIGFSHGGTTVLEIDMDGLLTREVGQRHSFDCGVNYYGIPITDMFLYETTMPVQIHVGGNDGSNDLSRNRDFAKKYKSNTELFVYANAEHGFDRVGTDITVRGVEGIAKGGTYKIKGDPVAREQSIQRVKAFFDRRLN
mgnify:CR=1 FL=1